MHNGKPWTFHNKCSLLMRGIKSDSSSICFNENIHLYVGLSFSQYMHYNQVPRRLIVVELFRLITHSWWTPKHDSCTAPDISIMAKNSSYVRIHAWIINFYNRIVDFSIPTMLVKWSTRYRLISAEKRMKRMKISSAEWRPFCTCFNVFPVESVGLTPACLLDRDTLSTICR